MTEDMKIRFLKMDYEAKIKEKDHIIYELSETVKKLTDVVDRMTSIDSLVGLIK